MLRSSTNADGSLTVPFKASAYNNTSAGLQQAVAAIQGLVANGAPSASQMLTDALGVDVTALTIAMAPGAEASVQSGRALYPPGR